MGCAAVFPKFDVFISLPVVSSIFTEELRAIFLAPSCISFIDSNNSISYSDSRSALQALGRLYTRNPLVLKIQRFLRDLHARRKFFLLLLDPLSRCALWQRKGYCFVQKANPVTLSQS